MIKEDVINPNLHQVRIDKLSHDGRGLARIDGKIHFIHGALPGELVECLVKKSKKDFAEGEVIRVLEASADRVTPICAHAQVCGGCSLQHLAVSAQIEMKQGILMELLAHVGHVKPLTVLPPLQDKTHNYRNKARLSVKFVMKTDKTIIGFRERKNPRYIAEIQGCSILHERVDQDIMALRALIDSLDKKLHIAQIEVAAGDTQIALIFRNLQALTEDDEGKLIAFGRAKDYKIYLQPKGEDSIYCIHPQGDEKLLSYSLPQYGITQHFHPVDFTQVNAGLNRKMVDKAIHLLDLQPEDEVLDLFCGLGNFSLPIAQKCAKVIGVEGNNKMVDRARMNARNNLITNTEFYTANLDDEQEILSVLQHRFSKVLIDPPRSGAFNLVKLLGKKKPERILYISCNPITLARDADILVNELGYSLETAGVMDMFSHTSHVESIALFIRE